MYRAVFFNQSRGSLAREFETESKHSKLSIGWDLRASWLISVTLNIRSGFLFNS